jgi:hypothetical protein
MDSKQDWSYNTTSELKNIIYKLVSKLTFIEKFAIFVEELISLGFLA